MRRTTAKQRAGGAHLSVLVSCRATRCALWCCVLGVPGSPHALQATVWSLRPWDTPSHKLILAHHPGPVSASIGRLSLEMTLTHTGGGGSMFFGGFALTVPPIRGTHLSQWSRKSFPVEAWETNSTVSPQQW